jgi:hypothetical protein
VEIIRVPIKKEVLSERYMSFFKNLIKAVVDIERELIALDGELHADLERLLLEEGSQQENLWGINLYPFRKREDFIEYYALINIRPHCGNLSMEIEDIQIKERIQNIVERLIRE